MENKKGRKVINAKKVCKNSLIYGLLIYYISTIIYKPAYDITKYIINRDVNVQKFENQRGTESPYVVLSGQVKDNEFVVLNAGSYNRIGNLFFETMINKCDEKDISLAIYVDSKAKTEEEIYYDVNLVRDVIKKYNVELPVYLNIDNIVEDKELNPTMKEKIIRNFLEKTQSNTCFVGIRGKDENCCFVKDYLKITEYDAYIIQTKDYGIQYNGTYNMYKDLDGVVHSKLDYAEIIEKKGMNKPEGFVSDYIYVVTENDTLIDISFKFDISVKELCSYNNIKEKDVIKGTKLMIPSRIQPYNVSFNYVDGNHKITDISEAQGTNINWSLLRDNFDQIVIKVTNGRRLDSCAKTNLINAQKEGFSISVYSYLSARRSVTPLDEDYRKFVEESADLTLESIKNQNISLPIFLDIEPTDNERYMEVAYSYEDIRIALDVWYNKIKEANHTPGLYTNYEGFKYIQNAVDYDITDKFSIWFAGSQFYDKVVDKETLNNVQNDIDFPDILSRVDFYQISKCGNGKDFGAQNHQGYLDVGYSYIDVEKVINDMTSEEQREFFRIFNSDQWKIFGKDILQLLLCGVSIFVVSKIFDRFDKDCFETSDEKVKSKK